MLYQTHSNWRSCWNRHSRSSVPSERTALEHMVSVEATRMVVSLRCEIIFSTLRSLGYILRSCMSNLMPSEYVAEYA